MTAEPTTLITSTVTSTVRIPPVLREEAGGARQVGASGSTVREVLDDLTERMPALGARVYVEGEIQPFVNVYVDGEDVRTRQGLDTPVADGSTVILLPAMAGGCLTPPTGRVTRATGSRPTAACRP